MAVLGRLKLAIASAVLLIASLSGSVHGQGSTGTMLTDLWWNSNEPGWGVTITESEGFLFLTFFIQKADGSPHWVTGQLSRVTPGTGVTAPISFAGDVFETRGTYYGSPWNPGQTSNRKVGTATFTAYNGMATGSLTYSIDGVSVQKSVQRQTLMPVNFSGYHYGGLVYQTSNCSPPSLNGQSIVEAGSLNISHVGSSISIVAQSAGASCTFSGSYAQLGQIGESNGTFSCADGTRGTFRLRAMQWTIAGMSALFEAQSQYCLAQGILGGITANHGLQ